MRLLFTSLMNMDVSNDSPKNMTSTFTYFLCLEQPCVSDDLCCEERSNYMIKRRLAGLFFAQLIICEVSRYLSYLSIQVCKKVLSFNSVIYFTFFNVQRNLFVFHCYDKIVTLGWQYLIQGVHSQLCPVAIS